MPIVRPSGSIDTITNPALLWRPISTVMRSQRTCIGCRPPASDSAQIDRHRVIEDAAEAIALALVHKARGWIVRRRLQRGESADWLLLDPQRKHVALEVSGIDVADSGRRLREKKEQARQTTAASRKAACVVELAAPRAALAIL